MDLLPDEDHEALAAAVREVLDDHGYPDALRSLPDDGVDRKLWAVAGDLGWLAVGLPEAAGGLDLGAAGEVMVFRELGRALAPGPFLGGALAAHAAVATGDTDDAAATAAGSLTVSIARATDGGALVVGPDDAALTVVVAEDRARIVEASALGARTRRPCIDPTTPLAVTGDAPRGGESVADGVVWRARLLAAAMLAGMAEATRDLATAHAKTREQFGQPLGAFQAVKHRCADMAVRAEAAWAQVRYAAASLDLGGTGSREPAAAFVVALDAARQNAASCVQVHGGIGFTAEHVAHRYVGRTHVIEQSVGPRAAAIAALSTT